MKSELVQALACPAAALLAVGIALLVLRHLLRRSRAAGFKAHLIRIQHTRFVLRLRDLVFEDPFRFMNMLCSKEGEWFVRRLWRDVGDECARSSLSGGAPPSGSPLLDLHAAHPAHLPDEGMGVEKFRMQNGSVAAIVKLPQPKLVGETFLIGVALPPDESLKQDLPRARRLVRFFIVDRWEGDRTTDFCEWTVNQKKLTYNVGAPEVPGGFAQAIDAKIQETRGRRM